MKYTLTKSKDVSKKEKFGINLDVFPKVGDCGVVLVNTEEGHNQEFYDKQSTFTYIILEGSGAFFLDDEEVEVSKGDSILIEPKTRIYYKGKLKMILITDPAWKPENEVETRASIWQYNTYMNNKLWFKRKLYGWGWTPCTWEGWLVLVIGLAFFIAGIYVGDTDDAPGAVLLGALIMTAIVFIFGYWKGEKPRWQWGKRIE